MYLNITLISVTFLPHSLSCYDVKRQLLPLEGNKFVQSLNVSRDSIFLEGWCHLKTSFPSQRGELFASHSGGKFSYLTDAHREKNKPARSVKQSQRSHEHRTRRRSGRILSDRNTRNQSPAFCGERRAELFFGGVVQNLQPRKWIGVFISLSLSGALIATPWKSKARWV